MIIIKKKSRNRTANKNRKSPKENLVTGTSCAALFGSPRVSQFPSKYKRKETHSNNKQRNGDPTVYTAPAAAERKEKETTCACGFHFNWKDTDREIQPPKNGQEQQQPLLSKMKKRRKKKTSTSQCCTLI